MFNIIKGPGQTTGPKTRAAVLITYNSGLRSGVKPRNLGIRSGLGLGFRSGLKA